ncbi:MAG TPA: hypothetical protein VER17_04745 [Tepidisphaeraceae bacterium]|nr:hypothetical protein [Tepidisphaeraceae bacterium]
MLHQFLLSHYDSVGTAQAPKQWSELISGAGSSGGQLMAMGVTNSSVTSKYYGRVLGIDPDGTDGSLASGAFFPMDAAAPNRSVAWHEFKAVISATGATTGSITMYVDGIAGRRSAASPCGRSTRSAWAPAPTRPFAKASSTTNWSKPSPPRSRRQPP